MPAHSNNSAQSIIDLTSRLIGIPSTATNPKALREALSVIAELIATCPDVTIEWFERGDKPSLLAYRGKIRPKRFDLILNAHIDVVPAPAKLFQARTKDGMLYGRGALDMKGTAACLTYLFLEHVTTVPYSLGLQIVTDEEIGGHDGTKLQIERGVRSKFVIIGEYANHHGAIYNAARGLCWAEIKFIGKSAHGGHLWHGTNAVLKASNFAAAVLATYPTPDKETWTTTASIASLETPNKTYNKVPDVAILKIDFRFTQEDPVFQSRRTLEEFITRLDPTSQLLNVATFEPAVNVHELNPYVRGLSRAILETTNTKPVFLGRPAGSDGRHYALAGDDIIEFGLFGHNSHSDNEYVELASFDEYCRIMRAFLKNPRPGEEVHEQPTSAQSLSLSLLRSLVSMRTITADASANAGALSFIDDFLRERGMFCERYEFDGNHSLYASTIPGNYRPKVLLSAHIDVVAGTPADFTLRISRGKLFGRGTADMKFAVASFMEMVDKLRGDLSEYDFAILITSDEEFGGKNGTGKIINELDLRPNVAVVPDGGENWEIETFSKGVQWIRIESTGVTGHASRPWEGRNAITSLLAAIRDIELLFPPTQDKKATTLTVGTIHGGTTGNQIPSSALAMLDIRYGDKSDFEEILPKIQAIAKTNNVKANLIVSAAPSINNPKHPYISLFADMITEVTGNIPGNSYSYGATDGRYFSEMQIPTIIVSPESGGRHTDNEWISVKGFEQFCTIIEQYVTTVASRKAESLFPLETDSAHATSK